MDWDHLLTFTRLDGGHYSLGQPLAVRDGSVLLGVLEPVRVSLHGTQVHIENFSPSEVVRTTQRNFGPLILLEVSSFLVERFASLQVIHYNLSRQIETYGSGMQVARTRAELLQNIGARDVTISPKPDAEVPGNFVVRGAWDYNDRNVAALRQCLLKEQEIYRGGPRRTTHGNRTAGGN